MANNLGTEFDDFLFTGFFDGVRGNDGDDTIFGDISDASERDLRGQRGDDLITAGSGGDILAGNEGNDTITGANGSNEVTGGDGDDVLSGGFGSDNLRGNNGNDVIGDLVDANDFFDPLSFGGGFDTMLGGAGNDTLTGGAGDTLTGGTGADLFRIALVQPGQPRAFLADNRGGQSDQIAFIGLPEVPEGATLRVRGVEERPSVNIYLQVLFEFEDGTRQVIGEFDASFARLQFFNNLHIVDDAPLV